MRAWGLCVAARLRSRRSAFQRTSASDHRNQVIGNPRPETGSNRLISLGSWDYTTLVAAQLEGFEAFGIEMTDKYAAVTRNRLTVL